MERKQKIEYYANKFAIYDDLTAALSSYSHGMKQKIAIISAWIHNPELIVMDEPFVGLDPESSHKLKEMMREHCDNGGMIFFSTHVLEVAERLCDKVAIIKKGKLIKSGTVEEVKRFSHGALQTVVNDNGVYILDSRTIHRYSIGELEGIDKVTLSSFWNQYHYISGLFSMGE